MGPSGCRSGLNAAFVTLIVTTDTLHNITNIEGKVQHKHFTFSWNQYGLGLITVRLKVCPMLEGLLQIKDESLGLLNLSERAMMSLHLASECLLSQNLMINLVETRSFLVFQN